VSAPNNFRDLLLLHFIVFLFGFTAILGKIIALDAGILVAWRTLIAALALGIWIGYKQIPLNLGWNCFGQIALIGMLVATHWFFFFLAIKISNVSVTLGCMATATLFASLLEPLLERRKIWWVEVVLGIAVLSGLYLITRFAFQYWQGIVCAVISAFIAVLYTIFNKRQVRNDVHPVVLTTIEMAIGSAYLWIVFGITKGIWPDPRMLTGIDWAAMGVLSLLCTAFAFVATVSLLKRLSAFMINLVINLEPVYGIVLAWIIFGEEEKMAWGFYAGAFIILLSVMIYPLLKSRFRSVPSVV